MTGLFLEKEDKTVVKTEKIKKVRVKKENIEEKIVLPEILGVGEKEILIFHSNSYEDFIFKGKVITIHAWRSYLERSLLKNNVVLEKDCWLVKADIKQMPLVIKELHPKHIWLLGEKPLDDYYKDIAFKNPGLFSLSGNCIPDRVNNCHVCPIYNPYDVITPKTTREQPMNFKLDDNLIAAFELDLKYICSCVKRDRPYFIDILPEVILDFNEVTSILEYILEKKPTITIDYETSGLKPYDVGHKIYTIGICYYESAVAFPFQYQHWGDKQFEEIKDLWIKILIDKDICKVMANCKFENKWSKNILGVDIENVIWDTMVTAHLIDSRKGITSLKIQAYLQFGIEDYGTEMKVYMLPDDKGFNTLYQAPIRPLCEYNAKDAAITYQLYNWQVKEVKRKRLEKINDLFLQGSLALADIEDNGINSDLAYFFEQDEILEQQLKDISEWFFLCNETSKFKKVYGYDMNVNSTKDLRQLFFDVLKLKSDKKTQKGSDSVDVEVLSSLGNVFADKILESRKISKIKNTYLQQYIRETSEDGKIHPSFSLHLVDSGRSSANSPNVQNIPKRDKLAYKIVKSGLVPSRGCVFIEFDYKMLEVRGITFYSKDPVLINYLNDKTTDMHYDQSDMIFIIESRKLKPEYAENLRFFAKNNFVFPQFYGDYYVNCAKNLWDNCKDLKVTDEMTVQQHLKEKGIKSKVSFERHLKTVEDKFWSKYVVTREWRDIVLNEYRQKGYVDSMFGYRRKGYMVKNQICNTASQGTSFHCLLWSLIQINKRFKEEGIKSKIVCEIHDSILIDTRKSEKEKVIEIVKDIMCIKIREEFDWINVPMEISVDEYPDCWYKED